MSILLRPGQLLQRQDGRLREIREIESENVQRVIYHWFSTARQPRQRGKFWVFVQSIEETNDILAQHGITYFKINTFSNVHLAEFLGVEAIVKGDFEISRPMSREASETIGKITNFYGVTNKANIDMFVCDAKDGKALVRYTVATAKTSGDMYELINSLIKKPARRIPYSKRRPKKHG